MRLPIETVIASYQQNLFRLAFSCLASAADADDAIQNTMIKYLESRQEFESEEHLRRWLFRVAINEAKNLRRASFFKKTVPIEDYLNTLSFEEAEDKNLLASIMRLPSKYRVVLQLFYYEEYSIKEIAEILHVWPDAIKTRLSRARKQLKEILKEEWNDEF